MFSRTLIFSLLMSNAIAQAQYQSVQDAERSEAVQKQTKLEAAESQFIGKQFWVVPNPKAISHVQFYEKPEEYGDSKFVLTEPNSFVITGYVQSSKRYSTTKFVAVKFQDGKEAFLKQGHIFELTAELRNLFEAEMYPADKGMRFDFMEYILPASPEAIRVADQKSKAKAAAAAAAWKARGGVRIGMTADQVRKSNWGKPEKVNSTSGSFGVHEQWVYDGGYIYLENGVVTAVQN